MHQQIMNAKPGERIEHINGIGLDNRRRNLLRKARFEIGKDTPKNIMELKRMLKNHWPGNLGEILMERRSLIKSAEAIRAEILASLKSK